MHPTLPQSDLPYGKPLTTPAEILAARRADTAPVMGDFTYAALEAAYAAMGGSLENYAAPWKAYVAAVNLDQCMAAAYYFNGNYPAVDFLHVEPATGRCVFLLRRYDRDGGESRFMPRSAIGAAEIAQAKEFLAR